MIDLSQIISEGTLRMQDVVPAFIGAYENVVAQLERAGLLPNVYTVVDAAGTVKAWEKELDELTARDAEDDDTTEEWENLCGEVEHALDDVLEHTGFYFGTAEGDGACFGIFDVDGGDNE